MELQLLLVLFIGWASAMYDSKDDVVELTSANFQKQVINDDSIWIVEFYAPWCGHCKVKMPFSAQDKAQFLKIFRKERGRHAQIPPPITTERWMKKFDQRQGQERAKTPRQKTVRTPQNIQRNLVPEYKKAAKALKGLVKVGAVDMTQHQAVGQPYNVQGFPTIKIFGGDKKKPTDFQGARTAQAFIDAAVNELKKTAQARLGGKSSSSGSDSGSRGGKGGNDVVELTDSNFEELVLNSKDLWLVEFFAPWCGHCKNLEPHWKTAATELKGKIKLGALDATVHSVTASKFNVRGYPSIKYFGPGEKSAEDAVDYDGGRTSGDIVQWALQKVTENLPAPEVQQATSQEVVEEACKDKQLCIVSFLPHILDCQSKCRNDYLALLKELADKYKKNIWGWVWTEAGQQPELEEAFGIGGFGYPAMIAVNSRKMKFSTLTGPFQKDGISEFLRALSYGKGKTSSVKGEKFPKVAKVDAWDGKDGVLPESDDIDLSDVDLDDDVKEKKTEL